MSGQNLLKTFTFNRVYVVISLQYYKVKIFNMLASIFAAFFPIGVNVVIAIFGDFCPF
jgi:hypothetical protein